MFVTRSSSVEAKNLQSTNTTFLKYITYMTGQLTVAVECWDFLNYLTLKMEAQNSFET